MAFAEAFVGVATAVVGGTAAASRRRWIAPEVVQTSSMDCGPAALKCLLEGHGIAASFGRLREACQTSVDGTSIDALEGVAQQLGLVAEQVLVPEEQVMQGGVDDGPALAVVCPDGRATHFVVLWRRIGAWVQVMDPAAGRRWMRLATLRAQLYRHEAEVSAADWEAWARGDEAAATFARRFAALGVAARDAARALAAVRAQPGWRPLAALDASLRAAASLVEARAIDRGAAALGVVEATWRREVAALAAGALPDAAADFAASGRSVRPADARGRRLRVRGAVLLRIGGTAAEAAAAGASAPARASASAEPAPSRPAELAAVLADRPPSVIATVARLLREAGHAPWLAWAGALAVTTLAMAFQLLLFRSLFDLAEPLQGQGQRGLAALALMGFLVLLPALELPLARESLRLGRQLELRLRGELAERLPRLHDRYFQSRPVADMADRAHGLHAVRAVPASVIGLMQSVIDLALTVAGVIWLAPASAGFALALAAVALVLPLAAVPWLAERDLRLRTHAAALAGFFLDALLGLVPVRAHRAQRAVMRAHEALAVEWARALADAQAGARTLEAVQGVLAVGLAAGLVFHHFGGGRLPVGSDLLLVFWVLKLPAIGQRVAGAAQALPAQRNALMRLLEPLASAGDAAPRAAAAPAAKPAPAVAPKPAAHRPALARVRAVEAPLKDWPNPGLGIALERATVCAGGHEILRDVTLGIAPGEQVAVVGVSGAGKSTLVGVLLGWHRLAGGRLVIDGRAAGIDDVEALRRHVAWVDPAVHLWNRGLLDNLRYASDAPHPPRLDAALEAAELHTLAARLPQGLQTHLGEGGGLLSGGEGQRVRLARALLQDDPRLVLLDEPFRGLDRGQRRRLLGEARRWWQGRTLLCVTHDVAETLDFPRVLVVDDGHIVEDGDPRRLVQTGSRYAALVRAEEALQTQQWASGAWRRLRLEAGRLTERA